MSGNKGMKNMIINELQDKFNPLRINLALDLPQIAVVGGQSVGKSSILESLVGKDFLPRGSGIVTRRPLILQLIHCPNEIYGVFLHLPKKRFVDFNDIREEIESETDRITGGNKGICSEPINLKIYSPDVVDLTLIDLPGLTKVPVENQPQDIEMQIRKMILNYITKENCLILAVTAANQDLATSDALQLAKEVDPDGKRTIGVLTKMDLMDEGTNARDILDGKLLPLKRSYIGVINRSQKDIDSKKTLTEALAYEKQFFSERPHYWDISDRLGTLYLQKYLNEQLSDHIYKQLPEFRDMCDSRLISLEERLENMSIPEVEKDSELILSKLNEQIRRDFELSIGRSASVKVDIRNLNGGTRINAIMNEKYPNDVTEIFYDENSLRREIAVSIENIHGAFLGIFTPDMAFEAVIRHQIEQFREPSLRCIDRISRELENIIKDCVHKIDGYPKVRELFCNILLKFVKECQKECKSRMNYMVNIQLAYMNTKHEEFVGINSDQQMMPSNESPNSDLELALPQHLTPQIEAIKKLVDSYVKILKKTFKDFMPKLIMLALIEATKDFIAVDLKLRVLKVSSADDIMEGPDVETRKDLMDGLNSYKETIAIIEKVLLQQ